MDFWWMGLLGGVIGFWLGRLTKSKEPVLGTAPRHAPPPAADSYPEVLTALRAGNKIQAIKAYREATGEGLKDAKDAVEALEKRL